MLFTAPIQNFITFIRNLIQKVFGHRDYTQEEVQAIYSTNFILSLAQSLLGVFTPIYIYKIAEQNNLFSSNPVTNGFIWILAYLGISSLIVVLSCIIFGGLIYKWTLKKTMFYGQLFLTAGYIFLFLAESNINYLFASALFSGIHTPFYWLPYHIFFVKKSDDGDRKFGTETGNRDFLVGIATALGPFVGSLIIMQLGFNILYAAAVVLILVSTMPILLYVKEDAHRVHLVKDVFSNFLFNRKYLTTTLALSGGIISNVVFIVFWSMMLFFGLRTVVEIGILTTLSSVVATSLLVIVGKMIDKHGKSLIHNIGVVINTVLHLTRPFINTPGQLYVNGVIDNVNSPAYNVPFNAAIYEKSLDGSISDFLVYREIVLHGSRFLIIILLGLGLYFTNSWLWVFYLGALGSLLTVFVRF